MDFQKQNSTYKLDIYNKSTTKAAYTLLYDGTEGDPGVVRYNNVSSSVESGNGSIEGSFLYMVVLLGGLGNITIMVITLICPTFRQMSTALLFHHCLLDAIKSGFCIPFGYSLIHRTNIIHCDIIGATYIFLMTVSAYNLLALLVNEEYHCPSISRWNSQKNGDGCCIAFGVVIIWFTTILLHLGVIFLPGNSEFSKEVGNCVYRYGVTKNYVIHSLWVLLVTGAIGVAAISFFKFFRKLQSCVHSRKWTFLHKSLSSLSSHTAHDAGEEVHYEFDDISSQKAIRMSRRYLRRIIIMMSMVTSFVICWYPLFILTLLDIHYKQPPYVYRQLMILAWAHPVTTPIFCGIIYYDTAKGENLTKDIYTNALPMTTSKSGDAIRQDINHVRPASPMVAFHNENFQSTMNHAGITASTSQQHSEPSSPLNNMTYSRCDTIVNYSANEGRYQTLIM